MQVRASRRARAAALAVGLAVVSCGGTNTSGKYQLAGSLGQVLAMGYDEVRVLLAPEDLSLQFVRIRTLDATYDDAGVLQPAATAEDYPFELTLALWGEDPPGNRRIDLTQRNDAGVQRGSYSRNVLNDPNTLFPDARQVDAGSMPCCATVFFKTIPVAGGKVSGDFNVTFENGIELASGRTVFGSFDAKVTQ